MEIKIYGLVDPRNNQIRYVGKTKNDLKSRLYKHIYESSKHNTHKHNWISSLKLLNLRPLIIELEICDENNWIEREQYWIAHVENLTNLTAGGDGGSFFENEIITKIGDAVKKKWEDPEYRKKISEKRKEFWSNPENRKNHGLKIKGSKRTKEFKENLSDIKHEQWTHQDYRDKMTKQSQELWKNEQYKKKTLKNKRGEK